jgi:hypothetical protein
MIGRDDLVPPLPAELGAGSERLNQWAGFFFASLRDTLRAAAAHSASSTEMEQELARHCFVLGLYDAVYRAGPSVYSPLYEVPGLAGASAIPRLCRPNVVADISAMASLFYETQLDLLAANRVTLGRTLTGSNDVWGADFDIVVDGCLIDVKSARDPGKLTPSVWP